MIVMSQLSFSNRYPGQASGPDGDTMLFYDQPEYDVFWKTVQDLDVPVYMHPRLASPTIFKQIWSGRQGWGPQIFSTGVSIHTLGLCGNGVFDRFPKVQFIIGHLGEGLPADIWRLDHCTSTILSKLIVKGRIRQKACVSSANNLYFTTSRITFTLPPRDITATRPWSCASTRTETLSQTHTDFTVLDLTVSSMLLILLMNGAKKVRYGGMASPGWAMLKRKRSEETMPSNYSSWKMLQILQ